MSEPSASRVAAMLRTLRGAGDYQRAARSASFPLPLDEAVTRLNAWIQELATP